MRIKTPTARKTRIEMLPLIDIVFLLLVVFIYSMLSMSVHRGLSVTLPVSSVVKPEKHLVLSVTVKDEGEIYVDEQAVLLDDLTQWLTDRIREEENPGVLLFARETVSYQTLFKVLDQIKLAGISRISLQAELKK